VRAGWSVVRRVEAPQGGRDQIADMRRLQDLLGARPGHGHRPRRPFLQEQLRRLDQGMGMEAPRGRFVVDHVPQRDDGHPLVMRHEGADDRDRGPFGQSRRGVVERVVEAAGAQGPRLFEA
jgi:hypothetical protein